MKKVALSFFGYEKNMGISIIAASARSAISIVRILFIFFSVPACGRGLGEARLKQSNK
jgi:hypothetical protein